jgi:hypothetical protein
MLTPYTENQKVRIINNVVRAANGDIEKLTKASYNFLYLASGFIAHYNLHGFIAHYSVPNSLRRDILLNRKMNMWLNFRPGERDYDYYMSKADIYQRICDQLI